MSFLKIPLYISYNPYILNKDQNNVISTHHDEFVNVEISATDLSSHIKSGYAYCAQMLGRRNKSNFLRSNIVFADVDGGMSLTEALKNDFVRNHATLISTTCSHTPEANRFRIGFVLKNTIEDPVRYAALARSVALRVCGDTRATDAARMFYGNTEADTQLFDAGIDHELAEELILQSLNLMGDRDDDSEARRALGQVSFRSGLKLRRDELIRTAQGQCATLNDIDARVSVHCPRHNDRSPSAFVVESSDKVTKGVHCRACAQTYWPEQPPLPDFDSFEAALREVKDYTVTHEDDGLFQNPLALPGVTAANIHFVEERFLTDLDPRPATTFVKSEKGTGKTELLKRISHAPGVNRVLFLGHRRTLVGSVCDRLGLVSYLQQHGETDPDRFGICLDSLPLVDERQRFDLVMIDESEQVIAHLLSSTLDAKRPRVLQSLARLLRMSNRVIVCDADLSWTSFLTISRMRQQGARPQDLQIIINTYRPAAGRLDVYASQNHLVEDFFRDVKLGQRCYFTSNSRALIEKLAARLSTTLPADAYITFTSVTSKEGSSRHKEFLRNPSQVAADYQVVLASPTLSSGVDISIPEPARQFDCVYGAFLPLVLTHFECDQQLARVRQPRSVKVYVSPARFNFETELGPVTEDLKKDQLMASFVRHVADDGKPEFMPTPMLEIAGLVRSAQRASMNELNKNFLNLKRRQGWTIRRIDNDPDRSALGREKLLVAQSLADQQYAEGILASHVLTDDELQDIEKRIEWQEPVNLMERLSYDRTRLERFYGKSASPELLEIDSRGDLRRKIMLLEAVLDGIVWGDVLDDDHGVPGDVRLDEQFRPVAPALPPVNEVELVKNRRYQSRLLRDLLNAAAVCTDDGMNFTKELAKGDLGELVKAAAVRSREFEAQFDRTLPPNLEKDPISFLRSLMKLVGLNLKHTRTSRRRGGGKTYHYTLADPNEVMRVVAGRQLRAEFAQAAE